MVMKINFINESNTKFRFYTFCNTKKIYTKKVNIISGEKCEIHFDEQKNLNPILLFISKILFVFACWNSNDDESNLIINKDVFIVEILPNEDLKEITLILNKDYHLHCNENVKIIENKRENENQKVSSWKTAFLLIFGFAFLVVLTFICFYLANGPF